LCINYDLKSESEQFVSDLKNAFSQCFSGFNENVFHDDYIRSFDKPKDLIEDEEEQNHESCMYLNSLIILLSLSLLLFSYIVFIRFNFKIDNE